MIDIKLYRNNSEANRVSKSITLIKEMSGTLREDTSILNPTLNIECDDSILNANYLYIPKFCRYYFITDIKSISNGIWRISADVDTLMSFSDYIYNQTGFVERQENYYNNLINDPLRDYQINRNNLEILCTDSRVKTSSTTVNSWYNTISNRSYIANLNGCYSTHTVSSTEYKLEPFARGAQSTLSNPTSYSSINTLDYSTMNDSTTLHLTASSIQLVSDVLETLAPNTTYPVSNLLHFPFSVNYHSNGSYNTINKIRRYNTTSTYISIATGATTNYYSGKTSWQLLADFTIPFSILYDDESKYVSYSTTIQLYVPFVGWIDLDTNRILGCRLQLYCLPDLSTGNGLFVLINGNNMIWSGIGKIAEDVPISKDNSVELTNQNTQFAISSAISALGTMVGLMAAPMTGGMSLLASGASIMSTVGKGISLAATQRYKVNPNIQSANQGTINPYVPRLLLSCPQTTDNITNYHSIFGLPLYKSMSLSSLKSRGYTKITSCHLTGDSIITKKEQDDILSKMNQGIIL